MDVKINFAFLTKLRKKKQASRLVVFRVWAFGVSDQRWTHSDNAVRNSGHPPNSPLHCKHRQSDGTYSALFVHRNQLSSHTDLRVPAHMYGPQAHPWKGEPTFRQLYIQHSDGIREVDGHEIDTGVCTRQHHKRNYKIAAQTENSHSFTCHSHHLHTVHLFGSLHVQNLGRVGFSRRHLFLLRFCIYHRMLHHRKYVYWFICSIHNKFDKFNYHIQHWSHLIIIQGFGDLVPGSDDGNQEKLALTSLYLLGGMSMMSMLWLLMNSIFWNSILEYTWNYLLPRWSVVIICLGNGDPEY